MRIELTGYKGSLSSLQDLQKIISRKRKGKALNYGQGEGQVEIDDTVWGIYFRSRERFLVVPFEPVHKKQFSSNQLA